jgi:hypothetical protein
MINVGDKTYYIDIKKLFKFVEYSNQNNHKETEITDGYDVSENSVATNTTKVIREITTPADNQTDNIRYDFVKSMLTDVLSMENGELDFGTEICFNTLIKFGILVEMERPDYNEI